MFLFSFFGLKARGLLTSRPGIEPAPPRSEGEVLTTGHQGSPRTAFLKMCFSDHSSLALLSKGEKKLKGQLNIFCLTLVN